MLAHSIQIDGIVAYVQVSKEKYAIIDACDVYLVENFKWNISSHGYAKRTVTKQNGKKTTVYMHRVIAATPHGFETDHINMDRLDNRRSNLRAVTTAENQWNTIQCREGKETGGKGVCIHKRTGKFQVRIRHKGKRYHVGLFDDEISAFNAYAEASKKFRGEFARTT